ncbi:MAG: hypothetical protein QMD01_07720 [Thermodesulfovibrionales bacterium]|nr:hypothetical protein [Thermodesulfovibrionales bacterium]
MFNRIKKDFDEGTGKIKWFASLLSERLRIEITVFKLLYKSEGLKKQRNELMKKIGEEVYFMREKEKNIYSNAEIMSAIKELESLELELKKTLEEATEISRIIA